MRSNSVSFTQKRGDQIKNQNNPIHQHHVPQVYLKNFCSQDGRLAVLNSDTGKIFSSGTSVIGAEKNFYTLDKLDDPYYWEKFYAKGIEPLMGDLFPQIISRGNVLVRTGHCIISPEEKIQLALILVMQLLRGKQSRRYEEDLFVKLFPDVTKKAKEKFGPLSAKQTEFLDTFRADPNYFKQMSMDVTLDTDRIIQYTNVIGWHTFVFYHICGNMEFVTSDNPFMLVNSQTLSAVPFSNGLIQESTLGYYPLSPKLLLCTIHPNAFWGALFDNDGGLFHLNSDSERAFINTINRKQKEQCYNQVYARNTKSLEDL